MSDERKANLILIKCLICSAVQCCPCSSCIKSGVSSPSYEKYLISEDGISCFRCGYEIEDGPASQVEDAPKVDEAKVKEQTVREVISFLNDDEILNAIEASGAAVIAELIEANFLTPKVNDE